MTEVADKTAYIDTSAVKLLIEDSDASKSLLRLMSEYVHKVSSAFLESEISEAVEKLGKTQRRAEKVLGYFALFNPDRSLQWENIRIYKGEITKSATIIEAHHLASALYLHNGGWEVDFICASESQAKFAEILGLRVVKI